jgi:ParB/RepB/Spo0J family partition protein
MSLASRGGEAQEWGVADAADELRDVPLGSLGERLSALRYAERTSLEAMRRSLAEHGQLTPLVVYLQDEHLEVLDGFKRLRSARALGWQTVRATVATVSAVEAKLRLLALNTGRGLTELEEAWLVRALYREDRVLQPEIARLLGRHKSWVWRRLMLVEALVPDVQDEVRLGLLAPRAAVALSRLPRGNQPGASRVVVRRGLTVRQTELLVEELFAEKEPAAREALLARRLDGPPQTTTPGPKPTRATRSEADWMSADILRVHSIAARLEVRLVATPLGTLTPAAAELIEDALVRLRPVLRALDGVIATITGEEA